MGNPIEDPLEITLPADQRAAARNILVAPGKLSTCRLLHDTFDADRDRWFDQSVARVTDGNEVMNLVRGEEAYADMVRNMRNAARPDPERQGPAFIYIAGWDLNGGSYFSMPMKSGDSESTLTKVLTAASAARVEVRAMLWANGVQVPFELGKNVPSTIFAIDAINLLPRARGVVDWKTAIWKRPPPPISDHPFHIGAHHQKMVIIHGSGRIVAYVGGLDLEVKRLDDPTGSLNPDKVGWQDVHCRIRGPAAEDVLATFSQRWNDYLNAPNADPDANHDTHKPKFTDELDKSLRNRLSAGQVPKGGPLTDVTHPQSVQICRTFHSKLYDLIPPGNRAGEKSIRAQIKKAIGQARDFIYMEDQYIFSMEISNALKAAIARPTFRWLIILIPPDEMGVNAELGGQASHRRAEFINNLRNAPGGEKVKVFVHNHRFVHSKIYIIDDKFAIIGSANCNRRGMEHDSEITAGIFDRASDKQEVLHFARRLRMRLWATHLNLSGQANEPNSPVNTQQEYAEMADGVASAVHWIKRPAKARVKEYTVNDDLNLAISTLKQQLDDLRDKIKKTIPKPSNKAEVDLQQIALDLVDREFGKFTPDKTGVDLIWNEMFDPGDP